VRGAATRVSTALTQRAQERTSPIRYAHVIHLQTGIDTTFCYMISHTCILSIQLYAHRIFHCVHMLSHICRRLSLSLVHHAARAACSPSRECIACSMQRVLARWRIDPASSYLV
jgi:hypothetical protein